MIGSIQTLIRQISVVMSKYAGLLSESAICLAQNADVGNGHNAMRKGRGQCILTFEAIECA